MSHYFCSLVSNIVKQYNFFANPIEFCLPYHVLELTRTRLVPLGKRSVARPSGMKSPIPRVASRSMQSLSPSDFGQRFPLAKKNTPPKENSPPLPILTHDHAARRMMSSSASSTIAPVQHLSCVGAPSSEPAAPPPAPEAQLRLACSTVIRARSIAASLCSTSADLAGHLAARHHPDL
jgi:hypothetical protein